MVAHDNIDVNSTDKMLASDAASVLEADLKLKLKLTKEKVKKLVKQQKLRLVGKLVQQANGDEPWGPAIQVKVQNLDVDLHSY